MRSRVPAARWALRAASCATSAWWRTRRASTSRALPGSVSDTLRWVRSKSRTPSSASSLRICSLTAGCATNSRSAARRKWSSSATATKYLRCRSSMDGTVPAAVPMRHTASPDRIVRLSLPFRRRRSVRITACSAACWSWTTTPRSVSFRRSSCAAPVCAWPARPARCASCSQEYRRVVSEPLRIVIGEDDVLRREGVARLLDDAGLEVVARAGDADDFLRKTLAHRPDVAVVDVQMPPRHEDDGLQAAMALRERLPEIGVLVLSQFYEESYALNLIGDRAQGVGYLLKERVADVDAFVDAVERVAAGGSALDPEIVGRMLGRRRSHGPLDDLTPRERDVLGAMAEWKSNRCIVESTVITETAVEKHVTRIFNKLALGQSTTAHRRVLAVLTYLRSSR